MNRLKKIAFGLLFTCAFGIGSQVAFADEFDDQIAAQRAKLQQIESSKINQSTQLKTLLEEQEKVVGQIATVQTQIDQTNAEMSALIQQIISLEEMIAKRDVKIREQARQLQTFDVVNSIIEIIVSSDSIVDALVKMNLMSQITGVSAGFMPVSQYLGGQLFQLHSPLLLVGIGFILGVLAILAEPAIYVLIDQIEDITGGTISRKLVLALISVGVGCAIALTVLRILIPELHLWHILLPGYALIIGLACFVPNLFVGIGFDSGGVASGPMTGTFIFAYVQGIAIVNPTANPIIDGFGMIALVAMVPILFIELLGFIYMMIQKRAQD